MSAKVASHAKIDRVPQRVARDALALLKHIGVKQRTIAKKFGITAPTVSHWRHGIRPIPVERFLRLHVILVGAMREDLARDALFEPERAPRRQVPRARTHEARRTELLEQYLAGVSVWAHQVLPQDERETVTRQVAEEVATLRPFFARGIESWSIDDLATVMDLADRLRHDCLLMGIAKAPSEIEAPLPA